MAGSEKLVLVFAVAVLFWSVEAQATSSAPPATTAGMTLERTTAATSTAMVGPATVPMATSDAPSTADGVTSSVATPTIIVGSTVAHGTTPTNMMGTSAASSTPHRDTSVGSDTVTPTGGAPAQHTTSATPQSAFENSLQVATKVEQWDEVEFALFQAIVTYGTNRYCNQGGASCFGLGSVKITPEDVVIIGTPITSRGTTTFNFFIRRPVTSPGAMIVPLHLDNLTAIIKEISDRLIGALADPGLTITLSASMDPVVTPSYTATRPPDEGFEPWMIAFVVTMAVIVVLGLAMFIYSKIKARRNKQMADFEMERNGGAGGGLENL
ncbi:uncharacterized protein LOC144904661 [Branchiostoma floridae x Branchiostoma belcheri]